MSSSPAARAVIISGVPAKPGDLKQVGFAEVPGEILLFHQHGGPVRHRNHVGQPDFHRIGGLGGGCADRGGGASSDRTRLPSAMRARFVTWVILLWGCRGFGFLACSPFAFGRYRCKVPLLDRDIEFRLGTDNA